MSKTDMPEHLRGIPLVAKSPLDRMPALAESDMSPTQAAAVKDFRALRGRDPGGPYNPLLRSPSVFAACNQLGNYLRFESVLPGRLSELAIIITARRWTQGYEWYAHRQIAEHAGLKPAIADAISEGRLPDGMAEDETTVYAFCTEVHRNGQVSDITYARAKALAGEQGIIELTAICGYYSLLAMVMNVARTPLPEGVTEPLVPFKA